MAATMSATVRASRSPTITYRRRALPDTSDDTEAPTGTAATSAAMPARAATFHGNLSMAGLLMVMDVGDIDPHFL